MGPYGNSKYDCGQRLLALLMIVRFLTTTLGTTGCGNIYLKSILGLSLCSVLFGTFSVVFCFDHLLLLNCVVMLPHFTIDRYGNRRLRMPQWSIYGFDHGGENPAEHGYDASDVPP